jgi:electron transport complex protein RnfC
MGLNPSLLGVQLEARDVDAALATNMMDCFECGCCAYVCPSSRPIVHLVKYGKAEAAARRAKAQAEAKEKAS